MEPKITCYPHFLCYWRAIKVFYKLSLPSDKFYQHFTTSYQLLYYFYKLLSPFNTFYQFFYFSPTYTSLYTILLTFYRFPLILKYFLSIKNSSISFFHLLTCNNHTVLLDLMFQALILCLSLFNMSCVFYVCYTKP